MTGPKPWGFWSELAAANIGREYGILTAKKRYVVVESFYDSDHDLHHAGETWRFLAYSFFPYDNGLQWFVTLDDLEEYAIPLYLAVEEFSQIAANISRYLQEL